MLIKRLQITRVETRWPCGDHALPYPLLTHAYCRLPRLLSSRVPESYKKGTRNKKKALKVYSGRGWRRR
ncbi:hypothetical protein V6N13_104581 [Hibiscus sabdariffa]